MFTGIVTAVTTWIKAPLNIAIAVIFGLLLGTLGVVYLEKRSAENSVATLTQTLATTKLELAAEKTKVAFKDAALAALDQARQNELSLTTTEQAIKQEVYSVPPSDDASIAPVLRRSLDGVARMLDRP